LHQIVAVAVQRDQYIYDMYLFMSNLISWEQSIYRRDLYSLISILVVVNIDVSTNILILVETSNMDLRKYTK
jgi:hypothetical protein